MNKDFLSYIEGLIIDARDQGFSYDDVDVVPHVNDPGLTYESGISKKGKKIKTCVLYVDIRKSVELVKRHQFDTMGKVYIAFTKSIIKAAHLHHGHVRNIIGDRVMIVFPVLNCFTNAVNCAITINSISTIINSKFTQVDFKCGIGIDYGNMRVLKIGVKRKGTENITNKNLVWVGYPANHASRLTDLANKTIETISIQVTYNQFNLAFYFPSITGLTSLLPQSPYIERKETLTPEEFANKIEIDEKGQAKIGSANLISFNKKKEKHILPVILITEAVHKGLEATHVTKTQEQWKKVDYPIKDIEQKVFGASLTWKL